MHEAPSNSPLLRQISAEEANSNFLNTLPVNRLNGILYRQQNLQLLIPGTLQKQGEGVPRGNPHISTLYLLPLAG